MRHLIWLSLLFLCFIFPSEPAFVSTHHLCPHDQMYALMQFKDMFTINELASTGCNSAYPKTLSWNNDKSNKSDCCLWDGVTCDRDTGHVIELDLSCSQLDGPFNINNTSSGILHLTHIQHLNLANNNFQGSHISPAFGRFANLTHLNLTFSSFSGPVPEELYFLSKLVSLDISSNYLTLEANDFNSLLKNLTHLKELILREVHISSRIPNSLMKLSSLEVIDLSFTELEGILPGQIFMLPNLRELKLRENSLSGKFPEISAINTSSLELLDLYDNYLFGETGLPDSIGNLTSLRILDLSLTGFTGELPDAIGKLKSLAELHIFETRLAGVLPDSVGNLTSLRVLDLSDTKLEGRLPYSIGNLKSLNELNLSNTKLSGLLPNSVWNLTSLRVLKLSGEELISELPKSIGKLKSLTELYLFDVKLVGELPDSIGNLTSLRVLSLSNTNLTGELPRSIGRLKSLTSLWLDGCNFSGSIPRSLGNLLDIVELDLSNNNFFGQIPITILNLKKLELLYIADNHISGPMSSNATGLQNLKSLSLKNNMINGTLPLWLFTVRSLANLDMSFNQLTGPIPDVEYELLLQSIDLTNNQLTGPIPYSIVNLVNLTSLLLSSNNLSGIVEPLVFSKLENLGVLDLSHNFFQGTLPVLPMSLYWFFAPHNKFNGNMPLSFCNQVSLEILDVSYNDLHGAIPQCLVNNSHLQVLDLQKNRFNGTIPPLSAHENELKTLNLNENHLEGLVPEFLSNCKKLELLDLGKNRLSGSFPYWLESLPELQVLVLHSNKFQGPIRTLKTESPFPKLRIFDLSHNEITGLLPTRYFQDFTAMKILNETKRGPAYMGSKYGYYKDSIAVVWKGSNVEIEHILTTLITIDLSGNKFDGEISKSIQELHSLKLLNLSHNMLTGPIPASLGNLSNLEILDLSSNRLTGKIPIELARITFLGILNVSRNHLVGPIPRGKQFDTFENNSYFENSGLCGFPLSKLCGNNKKPPSPIVTQQKEEHSIFSSGFTWKIVLFGYGCGIPFGVILVLLLLFFKWPSWLVNIFEVENHRKVKRSKPMTDRPKQRKNR